MKCCKDRLGSPEMGGMETIRTDPFFEGIDWGNLENLNPPPLTPFLPRTADDQQCLSKYSSYKMVPEKVDDNEFQQSLAKFFIYC